MNHHHRPHDAQRAEQPIVTRNEAETAYSPMRTLEALPESVVGGPFAVVGARDRPILGHSLPPLRHGGADVLASPGLRGSGGGAAARVPVTALSVKNDFHHEPSPLHGRPRSPSNRSDIATTPPAASDPVVRRLSSVSQPHRLSMEASEEQMPHEQAPAAVAHPLGVPDTAEDSVFFSPPPAAHHQQQRSRLSSVDSTASNSNNGGGGMGPKQRSVRFSPETVHIEGRRGSSSAARLQGPPLLAPLDAPPQPGQPSPQQSQAQVQGDAYKMAPPHHAPSSAAAGPHHTPAGPPQTTPTVGGHSHNAGVHGDAVSSTPGAEYTASSADAFSLGNVRATHSTIINVESPLTTTARGNGAHPHGGEVKKVTHSIIGVHAMAVAAQQQQHQRKTATPQNAADARTVLKVQRWRSKLQREQAKHTQKCTYVDVEPWEQACLRYIFPNAFEESIDCIELFSIAVLATTVILNLITVSLNVFQTEVDTTIPYVKICAQIVFIFEFAVAWGLLLLLIAVLIDGPCRNNVGTDYVIDIVEVSNMISSFSVLRAVSYVAVPNAFRRIVPFFWNGVSVADYLKGVGLVLLWIVAVFVACAAVVLKVTQVDFVGTTSITLWGVTHYVRLLGLVSNLGKVDTSYEASREVLLQACHSHYAGPGGPDSDDPTEEGLYSRLLSSLNIERSYSYEMFESVFNYHFSQRQERTAREQLERQNAMKGNVVDERERAEANADEAAATTHGAGQQSDLAKSMHRAQGSALKAFNFMAFVLRLNNAQLQRLLQMVESPMHFYKEARLDFLLAHARKNHDAMEAALRRADPALDNTLVLGHSDPEAFRLVFRCKYTWIPETSSSESETEM